MSSSPAFIRETHEGVLIRVKVQPRSNKNEIVDVLGDELRVRISAPPVDSRANSELIKFLSESIGCSKSSVSIVRGQTSRHKVLTIHGVSARKVVAKLLKIEPK